jgi:hypothetical protein
MLNFTSLTCCNLLPFPNMLYLSRHEHALSDLKCYAAAGTDMTAGESFAVPPTSLSTPLGCYGFSNTVETVAEAYQEWLHGLAGPHTAIVTMKGKVDANLVNMDSKEKIKFTRREHLPAKIKLFEEEGLPRLKAIAVFQLVKDRLRMPLYGLRQAVQSTMPCRGKNGGAKITNDFIEGCKRQGVTRSIFLDAVKKAFLDVSSSTPSCEVQATLDSINEILAKYT